MKTDAIVSVWDIITPPLESAL